MADAECEPRSYKPDDVYCLRDRESGQAGARPARLKGQPGAFGTPLLPVVPGLKRLVDLQWRLKLVTAWSNAAARFG